MCLWYLVGLRPSVSYPKFVELSANRVIVTAGYPGSNFLLPNSALICSKNSDN